MHMHKTTARHVVPISSSLCHDCKHFSSSGEDIQKMKYGFHKRYFSLKNVVTLNLKQKGVNVCCRGRPIYKITIANKL